MLYLEKKEKKKYSPSHPPIKNKKKKESKEKYSHVVSARARARKNFFVEIFFQKNMSGNLMKKESRRLPATYLFRGFSTQIRTFQCFKN